MPVLIFIHGVRFDSIPTFKGREFPLNIELYA